MLGGVEVDHGGEELPVATLHRGHPPIGAGVHQTAVRAKVDLVQGASVEQRPEDGLADGGQAVSAQVDGQLTVVVVATTSAEDAHRKAVISEVVVFEEDRRGESPEVTSVVGLKAKGISTNCGYLLSIEVNGSQSGQVVEGLVFDAGQLAPALTIKVEREVGEAVVD